MNIILIFAFPLWIIALLLVFFKIFYFKTYMNYKLAISNSDFESLIAVLNVVVHTEIDAYEKNIFDTKGAITPQNFENYYNDITHNIINSLSPNFYKKISEYMTTDAVIAYICRNVKEYLIKKTNGSI